ncbi:MAG: von Willebrand factor type A domain-containing protein [Anaerolineales bacterium]|nr:von Willebrand factor type A domain-containing protein [Anaerolineales bacterium]
MSTRRLTLTTFILLVLVSTAACGGAAGTEAPAVQPYQDSQPEYEVITEPPALVEPFDQNAPQATSAPAGGQGGAAEEQTAQAAGPNPPNDQGFDYTFFDNYGVNPFIDTEDDNLSTFAIDVDTGAYTIMRSYVEQGYLPPTDSVRVEEYVNYFDQGYASPPAGQAFAIHVDGAPSPFGETERYTMLRVGVQGYAVPAYARQDVSLTFVIDTSGSMNMDNRLELVKDALALLVEQLGARDRVAIIEYGSQARIVLHPTRGDEYGRIMQAINSLHPNGSTNAEDGLRLGYQMAWEAFNPEGINRVILCSDGVANVGTTSAGGIWAEIESYAERGITLTTVGFGMDNYNDVLMEQLADQGDGFYAYVDDLDEAERLFVENLTSTLQVIAMDAKIQVNFNPAVVDRYRLVGFENRDVADDDFRDDTVDGGEIGAGHSVTALYEVKLTPGAYGRIATIYLRWEDPATGEVIEIVQDFYTEDMDLIFEEADPCFQWSVIVAEYAEVLRDSYWARDSSLDAVLAQAVRVSELLPRDTRVTELVELLYMARRLAHD